MLYVLPAQRWYHDHSHPNTTRNTWMGLLGLFILDDDFDSALPLPGSAHELPLIICDRTFDANNQLVSPWATAANQGAGGVALSAPQDDVAGLTYLVNGVPQPYFQAEARRYRLRVLNGSVERPYDLRLTGGGTLTQIGNESGLLRSPAQQSSYPIGPAQRLDHGHEDVPVVDLLVEVEDPVVAPERNPGVFEDRRPPLLAHDLVVEARNRPA